MINDVREPDGSNPFGSSDALGISCIAMILMLICACLILLYVLGRIPH